MEWIQRQMGKSIEGARKTSRREQGKLPGHDCKHFFCSQYMLRKNKKLYSVLDNLTIKWYGQEFLMVKICIMQRVCHFWKLSFEVGALDPLGPQQHPDLLQQIWQAHRHMAWGEALCPTLSSLWAGKFSIFPGTSLSAGLSNWALPVSASRNHSQTSQNICKGPLQCPFVGQFGPV